MAEMEDKFAAILNNPQLMTQIMSIAQSMNQQTPQPSPEPNVISSLEPNIDPAFLQKAIGIANGITIDNKQQALLHALSAYLSSNRIQKLQKAMRAAKMANLATAFLSNHPFL